MEVEIYIFRKSFIRVHRLALFAQSATLCFQYLGFHDHTFNRAKLANYVISPGFHDFVVDSSNKCLAVRTVSMQRCPGFHKKQQNSLPVHCNVSKAVQINLSDPFETLSVATHLNPEPMVFLIEVNFREGSKIGPMLSKIKFGKFDTFVVKSINFVIAYCS